MRVHAAVIIMTKLQWLELKLGKEGSRTTRGVRVEREQDQWITNKCSINGWSK